MMNHDAEVLGIPEIDGLLTDSLVPLTEEELGFEFDQLSELAMNQPDDVAVIQGLKAVVAEAHASGYVGAAMRMAMTLGAMACLHSHLEAVAHEAKELLDYEEDNESDDEHKRKSKKHDVKSCWRCRAGWQCTKK